MEFQMVFLKLVLESFKQCFLTLVYREPLFYISLSHITLFDECVQIKETGNKIIDQMAILWILWRTNWIVVRSKYNQSMDLGKSTSL